MKDARSVERPAGSGPRTHEIGEHGVVAISTTSDGIVVRAVDGTSARLVGPDDADILTEATPGRFTVRTPSAPDWPTAGGGRSWLGSVLSFGRSARTIELEVPRDARLEVNTASGAVQVSGTRGGIAVHTASGDVAADDAAGELRVATASGRVSLTGPGRLAATVRTVSGDIDVAAGLITGLTLSTMSGRVEAAGAVDRGLDGSVSTASGTVRLALDGGVTVAARTVSGRARATHPAAMPGNRGPGWVLGDGMARVAVSTISGSIHLDGPRTGTAAAPPAPPPAEAVSARADSVPAPATAADADAPAADAEASTLGLRASPADVPASPAPMDTTLEVLRALERGEISVDEAARHLEGHDPEDRSDG